MFFRSISAVLVAGVTVDAVAVLGAASATPTGKHVLISGSISTTMADEVIVEAALWPNQESLGKGKVGDQVELLPVPVEISGGSHQVRIDPASVPAKYRSEELVDVELIVSSGDIGDSYSETARLSGGAWTPAARASNDAAARVTAPAGVQHNFTLADPTTRTQAAARPATLVAAKPGGGGGCARLQELVETYDKWVKVTDIMPSPKKMKGRFIYSSGASHTIGTAIKAGGWSAGGSGTEKFEETLVGGWLKGDHTAWTSWKYGEYKRPSRCNVTRVARAISHEGGYITTTRDRPNYSHCKEYDVSIWDNARGKAWTYGAGVEVHGLSLDAQTGYSEEVQVQYDIKNNKKQLCGNNDVPIRAELVMGEARD